MPQLLFLPGPRLPVLQPCLRPRAPPTCSAQPSRPQKPQIPIGASLEPSPAELSPLEHQLASLRFGYELPRSEQTERPCVLRYRCPKGHVVRTHANSSACRHCPSCLLEMSSKPGTRGGRRLNMCQIAALAHSRGGRLLSTSYVNARTPLLWRCASGHVWKATVSNVRSARSWCPECARQSRKLTIPDMQDMARERGGECLSTEYISEHVKLRWRCAKGHEFLLAPNNLRRAAGGKRKASWCKICAKEQRRATKAQCAQKQQEGPAAVEQKPTRKRDLVRAVVESKA